jgi:hypothetical protein
MLVCVQIVVIKVYEVAIDNKKEENRHRSVKDGWARIKVKSSRMRRLFRVATGTVRIARIRRTVAIVCYMRR